MHVLIGKRQIVLAALVVMLGLAVFVNWYYTNNGISLSPEGQAQAGTEKSEDGAAAYTSAEGEAAYFATVKLNREASLSAALEELEAVMAGAGDASGDEQSVREKIALLTASAKKETDIEGLVSAQIGGECVAVVSENGVDVIVPQAKLNESNVLAISDIVRGVCGAAVENVRVAAALA